MAALPARKPTLLLNTADLFSLVDWGREELYSAIISVGTPPQQIQVHLDTGSSDLTIYSPQCTAGACTRNKPEFDSTKSSTFKVLTSDTTDRTTINYGSGFSKGKWVSDKVTVGGFSNPNQGFLYLTQTDWGYNNTNVVGLMGLGFPQLAAGQVAKSDWWTNVVDQWPDKVFGFYLSHSGAGGSDPIPTKTPGGFLTLGGTDPNYYTGAITYTNVNSNNGFWQIPLGGVAVDGKKVVGAGNNAIIDTGTTLLLGPESDVAAIHAKVPGAQQNSDGSYLVPCDSKHTVSLTFGGRQFTIPASDFVYTHDRDQPQYCFSGIVADVGGIVGGNWLVGDQFLKNVYTAYRYAPTKQVGFATLK